ncbi:hypothetical protein Tco_1248135 [Tanacetum coccineum]
MSSSNLNNIKKTFNSNKRHKQVLKTENPGKRIAFLENEYNKSFAKWLRKEVERELAISKESVSETVRWISYGPRATVVKCDAYNINGYTFPCTLHLQLAYAHFICTLHLQLAFASKHLHIAVGDCICTFAIVHAFRFASASNHFTLHLHIAFAGYCTY